jgi:hypothetical protein
MNDTQRKTQMIRDVFAVNAPAHSYNLWEDNCTAGGNPAYLKALVGR